MLKEESLNVSMMKQIARKIIAEEEEKWNINLKIYPLTFIEYYRSDIFKQRFKLHKSIYNLTLPLTACGINDLEGSSIIFLNNYFYYIKNEQKLFDFLLVCYHEYRHSIQQHFKFNTYDAFLYDVEQFMRGFSNLDYALEHDKYSFEIGTNLYSVRSAREYMKNNYPELYEKHRTKIDELEQKYLYDYMTYDATDLIERTIKFLKFNNKINNSNLVSKIGEKTNISIIKKIDIKDIPVVLQCFLNADFSFKSIKEIMRLTSINNIDKKIVYHVLSCNSFLKDINMETLSQEELEFLNESLNFTYTIYENQKKYMEKVNNSPLKNSNIIDIITHKMNAISKFVGANLNGLVNISRNEWKRQNNIRGVADFLNESENLIGRRTR